MKELEQKLKIMERVFMFGTLLWISGGFWVTDILLRFFPNFSYLPSNEITEMVGWILILIGVPLSYLGFKVMVYRNYLDREYAIPQRVKDLDKDSFLYQAGLKNGDVIIKIEGEDLMVSSDWWRKQDQVHLIVWRNGQEFQVTLRKE